MAKLLKLRRGTTSQHSSFTGAEGEVTVDTDKEALVVHNGSTAGGFPVARADGAGITNFTITGELDAATLDISGNADIDGTLEADAITVNGTALSTVIAGTTVTTATNAAHVTVTDNESTNEENLITFVEDATSSTGSVGLEMDGHLTYNPSTGTVTSTIFKGNIDAVDGDFDGTLEADAITVNGTALSTVIAGTTVTNATNAVHVSVADNESTNENNLIPFIEDASATGNVGLESDGDFHYNPSTGLLSCTGLTLSGNLTVNGTTTTVATTNTTVTDNLLELNSGAGSNANDAGILIERGSTGDNAIIAWDESEDKFIVGTTTAANDATGNLSITKGTIQADVVGDVTGDVTGDVSGTATTATNITVADESSDTSCNVVFTTAATGNLPPKTGDNLTFNSNTGILTATGFSGNLTGSSTSCSGNAAGLTGSPNISVGTIGCGAITGTSTISDSKGNLRSIPQNTQGGAYTLVVGDAGKHILASGNITWSDNVHAAGDAITIVNNTAGDITITKGTTMYSTADASNANRTLATRGMATILWASGTVSYISGSGLS